MTNAIAECLVCSLIKPSHGTGWLLGYYDWHQERRMILQEIEDMRKEDTMTQVETNLVAALKPLLGVAEFIQLTVAMPTARACAFETAITVANKAIKAAETYDGANSAKLQPDEYVRLAGRTEAPMPQKVFGAELYGRLIHAQMGMLTEVGGFADVLKKSTYYGKMLDTQNLAEELGDLCWYIALACNTCGFSLEQIMQDNINKLKQRYPDKFTEQAALNRDLTAEAATLTAGAKAEFDGY